MGSLLHRFLPELYEHPSDDLLGRLWSRDFSWSERFLVRRHLVGCPSCRVRMEHLKARAYGVFSDVREMGPVVPPDDTKAFLQRLDRDYLNYVSAKRPDLRWPRFSVPTLSMNPSLIALSFAVACAVFIGVQMWTQHRLPKISSESLLTQAAKWDTASYAALSSVVSQTVRIQASGQALNRTLYRDPSGKRRMKAVSLENNEARFKNRVTMAGVDWNNPLSATNYRNWHNGEAVREDSITRAGSDLLTLTTTAPQGLVAEQSLTVRESDFHPVRRTIAFRDSETVEIAEVEFKTLPWNAVEADVFESLEDTNTANAREPRVLPFRMPSLATPQQIDEAELSARLVLNQLHADTWEQIELKREAHDVVISGLVDTDERKHQLEMQLRTIPHLVVAIQSLTNLPSGPGSPEGTKIAVQTSAPELSPLEDYLKKRGWSSSSITDLSHQLKRSALAISQESRAIGDLQSRFVPQQSHSLLASATLSELMFSHRQRLQEALAEERKLLGSALGSEVDATAWSGSSLPALAEKNLALCNELTTSGISGSRDGQTILAELAASAGELTADALHVEGAYRSDSAATGKK